MSLFVSVDCGFLVASTSYFKEFLVKFGTSPNALLKGMRTRHSPNGEYLLETDYRSLGEQYT